MDVNVFGITQVAVIVVLVYVAALIVRATRIDNKWIPAFCGVVGIALGIVAYFIGMAEFPAQDIMSAAAVGGVSGLAATGINQIYKQLAKGS